MHDTAMEIGRKFFKIYRQENWELAIDCGAMDINGSLRDACPNDLVFLGIDIAHGKSVDIKVNIGEPLPFRDDFADCILSSSQMEHDDFFWMTFLEYVRVIRDGGYIYINAPSNGNYHRYPNDNWRFYPDCGHVFVRWAQRNNYKVHLVESFICNQQSDIWNDFVAVFRKGEPVGYHQFISDEIPCRNVWKFGASEPEKFAALTQDRELFLQEAEAHRSTSRALLLQTAVPADAVGSFDPTKALPSDNDSRIVDSNREVVAVMSFEDVEPAVETTTEADLPDDSNLKVEPVHATESSELAAVATSKAITSEQGVHAEFGVNEPDENRELRLGAVHSDGGEPSDDDAAERVIDGDPTNDET